jgi:hypothetical protein
MLNVMEDLFRSMPKLLREFEDTDEIREAIAIAAWRRIAGDSLCEHAVPFRLFNKHLIVAVTSNTWKKHLEHLSGQMIFKLNSVLGQALVTFIEFRVDEDTVLAERTKNKTPTVSREEFEEIALDEVTPKLRGAADAIKDDNLRYQFLIAAGSCLARKKKLKENG